MTSMTLSEVFRDIVYFMEIILFLNYESDFKSKPAHLQCYSPSLSCLSVQYKTNTLYVFAGVQPNLTLVILVQNEEIFFCFSEKIFLKLACPKKTLRVINFFSIKTVLQAGSWNCPHTTLGNISRLRSKLWCSLMVIFLWMGFPSITVELE